MFDCHVNKQESQKAAILLFLIGLFSQTQINMGGKLGVSEFFMVACAAIVFLRNYKLLLKDRVAYFFWLILLWLGGAVFVDLYTHNMIPLMMRGIAVPITVFANCICIYMLLRKDYDNLKWFLLGFAISGVVSIFILQRGIAGDLAEEQGLAAGMERVIGYKLFWVNQLTAWLTLPIVGWYSIVPRVYSLAALSFLFAFDLITGGRSAALAIAVAIILVAVAGKARKSMLRIKRHILLVIIVLLAVAVSAKYIYECAVEKGYLGESEEKKFERQTAQGSGIIDMLMAGRSETFIGLMAALDKPIMGHGSVAIDSHGYILDFFSQHGSYEEYFRLEKVRLEFGVCIIPAHSHIINYWMWHGIFALFFWLVVLYLAIRTLFSRMHIYPGWYGYFAISIPLFFWDIFFSPFGQRVLECTMFVAFLLISKLEREQKLGISPLMG